MQTKALCLNDAFTLVRDRKPDVAPNFHFMQQLHSYEQQLLSSQNRTLMPNTMHTATDEDNGGLGGNSSISGTNNSSNINNMSISRTIHHHHHNHNHKFSTPCVCSAGSECKCMQTYINTVGVSPDSGIEFDRWTPSESGSKWDELVGKSFVIPSPIPHYSADAAKSEAMQQQESDSDEKSAFQ